MFGQEQQPTQLDPRLQALMILTQQPPQPGTVAGNVVSQMTQPQMPGMPDAQQQAGLGGAIQAMQQQKAQQAMMQMAQRAQQPPGIEGASVGNMDFASGGIVGFAEGGTPEAQEERDKKAMLDTIRRLAAAGYDVTTLIPRGVMGAAESVITRPLRAMGVPIPYLPEEAYGGNRKSMTPMYDKLRAEEASSARSNVVDFPVGEEPPIAQRRQPAQPQPSAQPQSSASGTSVSMNRSRRGTPPVGIEAAIPPAPPAPTHLTIDAAMGLAGKFVPSADHSARDALMEERRGLTGQRDALAQQRITALQEEQRQRQEQEANLDKQSGWDGLRALLGGWAAHGMGASEYRQFEVGERQRKKASIEFERLQKMAMSKEREALMAAKLGDNDAAMKHLADKEKIDMELKKLGAELGGRIMSTDANLYGTDVGAHTQAQDRRSREGIAKEDRASRERIAAMDRENALAVARIKAETGLELSPKDMAKIKAQVQAAMDKWDKDFVKDDHQYKILMLRPETRAQAEQLRQQRRLAEENRRLREAFSAYTNGLTGGVPPLPPGVTTPMGGGGGLSPDKMRQVDSILGIK